MAAARQCSCRGLIPDGDIQEDVFRDTPVRYLGYANELGESFKTHIPRFAYFGSYLVASSYAIGDASSKAKQVYQYHGETIPEAVRRRRSVETFVEAAAWQGLASVIIPGFTINRICAISGFLLKNYSKLTPGVQKWTTTLIGLAAIPLIIKPIDRSVDVLMDSVVTFSQELGISHQCVCTYKKENVHK